MLASFVTSPVEATHIIFTKASEMTQRLKKYKLHVDPETEEFYIDVDTSKFYCPELIPNSKLIQIKGANVKC